MTRDELLAEAQRLDDEAEVLVDVGTAEALALGRLPGGLGTRLCSTPEALVLRVRAERLRTQAAACETVPEAGRHEADSQMLPATPHATPISANETPRRPAFKVPTALVSDVADMRARSATKHSREAEIAAVVLEIIEA